ncbi:MAG: septum site-determining protein MinC [Chitinophagaceae bacterium]|nr:septum site-determining protein MinC [Polaromonas sp.]
MTVAIAATTPATFEIKSANLPLVALLLKSFDLSMLAREMTLRFGDIPDFFDHDALIIDLQQLPAPTAEAPLDFAALMALLRSFRLQPIAVKGGNPAQMAAALAVGLMAAPDAHLLGKPKKSLESPAPAPELAEQQATTATATTPAAPASGQLSALIIDKPLRSGQQVYARGRDLVVLAIVNAGAEVIADGHIHVYAPLRGKAMAGARGNPDARIFALALDAELLSIAGVYRTSEQPLPASVQGKPTQVRLVSTPEGDKLMMESMKS